MIDYGALQPSPVGRAPDAPTPGKSAAREVCCLSLSQEVFVNVQQQQPQQPPPPALVSPAPTTTPSAYTSSFVSPAQPLHLDGDETFDMEFDFSNAEMESMMMNATQEFWASFPGEVGVGFPPHEVTMG